MADLTLGLDLGPNSIGWALIDEEACKIVAAGVRIFPEGVDNFDTTKEKPKNESRRMARGMRRQIARRARRKRNLKQALIQCGLFPAEKKEQTLLFGLDPYTLRCKGLREKLTLHEFGRVLIHLNQRRGFLSNRKSDRGDKEVKGLLKEINELDKEIAEAGNETLGERLAELHKDPHRRIRTRHTRRRMFLDEFELLWERQSKHYPEVLTDKLKNGELGPQEFPRHPEPLAKERDLLRQHGLHGLIFFQRPMYWPKSVVGECELEPGKRRCPRADRLAQRYRMLQEVNNLAYIEPTDGEICKLTVTQRKLLLAKLSEREEMTFDQIRKALGFLEPVKFNFEEGKRSKLKGMVTDALIAHKSVYGPDWFDLSEDEKNRIVRSLLHRDEREVRRRAVEEWGLSLEMAEKLLDVELPPGYGQLSQTALEKLRPPLERGLLYMTGDNTPSALSEAGYLRPDQQRRQVQDLLPSPPAITNPIVRQALHEVRKVVNAIVRKYGKPKQIRLELARDAKASAKQRAEIHDRIKEREALRDEAAKKIRELRDEHRGTGVKVNRDSIERYLLWQEQKHTCIYSGEPISFTQLFGGECDVDHILPRSRTLDDSFDNKVVCLVRPNRDKRQQTPYEWLGKREPERFADVLQRARVLQFGKRRRFAQKELETDKFVARQLNDTRYISRAVLEYIRCLYDEPHHVLCIKGQQTATLRHHWGLETVLCDLKDSPAWVAASELRPGEKNRLDHRHHAIDAIVIALTGHKRLQELAAIFKHDLTGSTDNQIAEPWKNFRGDVDAIVRQINVSHRVRRKVGGELHEKTHYGATAKAGEYVYRKPITALSVNGVRDIRDPIIRQLVEARLAEHEINIEADRSGDIPKSVWEKPLLMPSGVHVKKVRILMRDNAAVPVRNGATFVSPGRNHHLVLATTVSGTSGRQYFGKITTMFAVANRVRSFNKQSGGEIRSLIERDFGPEYEFAMSLSIGEAVIYNDGETDHLCVVQKMSGSPVLAQQPFDINLRHHADARKKGESKPFARIRTLKKLSFKKVTVDPLGRIRWAND